MRLKIKIADLNNISATIAVSILVSSRAREIIFAYLN
jgi:hypothetical protein